MRHIFLPLKRTYLWCRRFRHRKGYGVQSPFAYDLIRQVICERGQYYAYASLRNEEGSSLPHLNSEERKVDTLLFRLSNYAQPTTIYIPRKASEDRLRYLETGCSKAAVRLYDNAAELAESLQKEDSVGLLYVQAGPEVDRVVAAALPYADARSLFIITGIHQSSSLKHWWQSIAHDRRTGVTFDLYEAGLVFFDPNYVKQHYIVNF